MDPWGWRVPFLVGSLLLPFLLVMRSALAETGAFEHGKSAPVPGAILASLAAHSRLVLLGMAMTVTTSVFFYMLTAYTPTYGTRLI